MEKPETSFCCRERGIIFNLAHDHGLDCITQHPGYDGNCLNEYVVETSFFEFLEGLRAVTNQRISETRAGRVEKIAKFHIRQTHVGNTFKTRYKRVGYAWCTSGARRCTSLYVAKSFIMLLTLYGVCSRNT